MDRSTYYSQEILRTADLLQPQQSAMIALGKIADMVLGTGTLVDGLSCVPTGPASLSVLVNPGQIYSLANLEATTWSALPADTTHQIVKQGVSLNQQTFTITPPATGGFSQVFLVEVQYADLDTGSTVLPYFNVSNPPVPLSGPGNSGTPQNTQRTGVVSTQIKAGTAAATGTQSAPSADAGWTGLFNITVANGQTTITSGNIVQVATAPFITSATLAKLTAVPAAVQGGNWTSATDTGALNALAVTLAPAPAALTAMMQLRVRVANTNTGATTLNVNGLGALPVVHSDQSALNAGDITSGQVAILLYDLVNNNWQITKTGLSGVLNESQTTLASAGTVNIGASSANHILISGTTGITAFDTITAGAERTLEFQGIVTLTHSANIILPGAIPYQTAAGDVLKFRSEGAGVWRCVTNMRAATPPVPANANPFGGMAGPLNMTLTPGIASNILTVNMLDSVGNTPSVASPVWIPFRDPTVANGGPIWRKVTAALPISTFATGATLGSTSGSTNPFRFWIVAFDNAGTVVLGLINCSVPGQIFPLNEAAVQTSTPISGTATAAGTYYTPNGTTVTAKSICILGYLEYNAGLTTAGTYNALPTAVRLFGPGVKKPGDVMQTQFLFQASNTSSVSGSFVNTGVAQSITPTSSMNPIKIRVNSCVEVGTSGSGMAWRVVRGASTVIGPTGQFGNAPSNTFFGQMSYEYIDQPGVASATTYTAQIQSAGGSAVLLPANGNGGSITLDEVMG